MITALKTSLGFEPKLAVALDAAATTETPEGFKPQIGVLAYIPYKPAKMRYLVRMDQAPTQGEIIVKCLANSAVIGQVTHSLTGNTELSGNFDAILSGVSGDTPLALAIEVSSPSDAGRTAEASAFLDIEQPLSKAGC